MVGRLEVRIPISPTDHYFNRVRLITTSIRSLGGDYAEAHVRVSVGADQDPEDLYARLPWSKAAGIEWVWVNRREFNGWRATQHEYIATMMERFRPPFQAPWVLMLDADVIVMRPFDELFEALERRPAVAGMMAHVSPFRQLADATISSWPNIFTAVGLPVPLSQHQYSGWGIMEDRPQHRFSPPYFNTGVLLASDSMLHRLYEPYILYVDAVRSVMNTYFVEQLALTIAMEVEGIQALALPLRYNFPNQPAFDEAFPNELESVVFLHFLRTDIVSREADFESQDAIDRFVARPDLAGSNEAFRRRVASLLSGAAES